MRWFLVLLAIGCGGGQAAPTSPSPHEPAPPPALGEPTTGDPATRRNAQVIAAQKAPASLWRDDAGDGALVTAPTAAPDRIAVALTPTGRCGEAACTFYEHRPAAPEQLAGSLTWREYGPDRRVAPLWGRVDSGPAGVLVEVKAGSSAFWHMHRHDVRIVVLAGTVEYLESGQPTHTLAPGAYVLQPRGYKHSESCKAGADCVLYIHSDRGFDVKPL